MNSYLEICAGCGGLSHGLELSGLIPKALIEVDKDCVNTLNENFDDDIIIHNDTTKIDYREYKEQIDIVVGGIPCFVAGTNVLTDNGYKNIEDVEQTDKLMTHKGNFKKILNLQHKKYSGNVYDIRIKYHPITITCTPEHPFYIKEKIWNQQKKHYQFSEPKWKDAKEIENGDCFSMKINTNNIIPEFKFTKKINRNTSTEITTKLDNVDMWFMMGYFIGNGWVQDDKKSNGNLKYIIRFAISNENEEYVTNRIQKIIPITDKKCDSGKCKKFGCGDFIWYNILGKFGRYAHGKFIPEWVHDAPKEYIKEFIMGYIKADGCIRNGSYSITTVSYNLALGIQRLCFKLGYIFSITKYIKSKTHIILGRLVNQRDTYTIRGKFKKSDNIYCGFIEDDYVWLKLTNIKKRNVVNVKVYNFEVSKDNSYIVENTIVHNCQSYSIAGKREGLKDKEKGVLFFEFIRCLQEIEPLMFMIENVEGLTNIDNGNTLKFMIKKLEELGYTVSYQVLYAVDYLVPQKRKRLIIIGTTYDVEFEFPKKHDKLITLKNALKKVPKSDGITYSSSKKKILDMVPEGGCWIDLPIKIQKEYLKKSYFSGGGKRGIAKRLSWDEPCLTLTTSPCQKQTERCHPTETRPLTIREYARIQTFPDDFKFCGSVSSQYKQIGNAVPVMLAYFVGKEINKCLNKIKLKILFNEIIFFHFKKVEKKTNYELCIQNIKSFMVKIKKLFISYYQTHILPLYEEDVEADSIDKLKKQIDIGSFNISEQEWQKMANYCLQNNKIQQQIGKMHEFIISKLDGWMNCKNAKSKIPADVMKQDETVFLELKNRYNTMNYGGKKSVVSNLVEIKKKYPKAIVGIGIINGKNGKSYKKRIHKDGDIEIYEFAGKELSKVVYNNENLFDELETIVEEYFKKNSKQIKNKISKQ